MKVGTCPFFCAGCGVESYTDYYEATNWNRTWGNITGYSATQLIPASCCQLDSSDWLSVATCPFDSTYVNAYTDPCYTVVSDEIWDYVLLSAVVTIAIVPVLDVIMTALMICLYLVLKSPCSC